MQLTQQRPTRKISAAAAAMMSRSSDDQEDILATILGEARERIQVQMTPSQIEDPSDEDMRMAEGIIRPLVDSVFSRSLHGGTRITQNQDDVVRQIVDEIFGFGPLAPYLADSEVEEVIINGPDNVSIIHADRGKEKTTARFRGATEVANFVNRAAGGSTAPIPSWTPACGMAAACTPSWLH